MKIKKSLKFIYFRMSKEDLIQICGLADGIRMFNILRAKYVFRQQFTQIILKTLFHYSQANNTTYDFVCQLGWQQFQCNLFTIAQCQGTESETFQIERLL